MGQENVEEMVQTLYSDWRGNGMIAELRGVPHITVNTSTMVPVQIYSNAGKVIRVSEVAHVDTTSHAALSTLGITTETRPVSTLIQPTQTPRNATTAPLVNTTNNTHHAATLRVLSELQAGNSLEGNDVVQQEMENASTEGDEDNDLLAFDKHDTDGYLGLEREDPGTAGNGNSDKVITNTQDTVVTTPSPKKQRGKEFSDVCNSGKRDQKGQQIAKTVMRTKGGELALVKYSDDSTDWVAFNKLNEEHRE